MKGSDPFRTSVKTIIFDFDGTLADTSDGIIRTMRATLTEMGLPVTDDGTIRYSIGLPLAGTMSVGGHVPDDRVEEGVATYRRLFDIVAMPGITLFDGVKETILKLKDEGYTLAIATSRGIRSLSAIIEAKGLNGCFDALATSNDGYKPKPAPDMVLALLEKLGADARETLVVGDTTYDLDMGKSAGCRICGVSWGNHSKDKLLSSNPDCIIDSFYDLPKVILQLS